jgi:2'-5' RNA ligase
MSIAELKRQLPLLDDGPRRPNGPGGVGWQDKLYFALRPDFGAARRMAALGERVIRAHRLSGRLRPLETFHVSVLGVGFFHRLSREELAIAEAAARAIVFAPFTLTFTQVMTYPKNSDRHPVVLHGAEGAEQVNQLAMVLATAMAARGFRPHGIPKGQAHLTLLYDRAVVPPTPLAVPIALDVAGVFLVRSHHGQSRHENQLFSFRS